ncbi:hypothetical protein E2C01_035004 [Portunus trituberculatus]|uniref:Uncharacterized protein n=1 Tax=Portunus trituberculatus TaxID=210409 RepID=A0A5B7F741_PORTR|nr:hypothetical protein [Portunus trituberculatus]
MRAKGASAHPSPPSELLVVKVTVSESPSPPGRGALEIGALQAVIGQRTCHYLLQGYSPRASCT